MGSGSAVDVLDTELLAEFRTHHEKWCAWTISDDENSLQSQFSTMFWSDAVFRLINETRRATKKQIATFNGALAELIDSGYVAGQSISIRRLVDRRNDVISLRRVCADIIKHRHVLTREIYVSHDGDPYDYEAAEDKRLAELMARPQGVAYFGDRGPTLSKLAHDTFDRLSKTAPGNRRRDDIIHHDIFVEIEDRVSRSGAKEIVDSANKFLFHAADICSRKNVAALEPTLQQIADVHSNLAQIGNCLSAQILNEGPCALGVATAQFDILHLLDKSFIDTSDYDRLTDWWAAHSEWSDKHGHARLAF